MAPKQFRVLYRAFLFRVIDREFLSVSAQGDATKLLGRFASILVFISIPFALFAAGVGDPSLSDAERFALALAAEHSLFATTMLIVGVFAVLSWDSVYPENRDVLVLGPLPVRATTIFLAKVAALGTALCLTVITFNAMPGLLLPFALAPHTATILDLLFTADFYQPLAAYWLTVIAAGLFVIGCVLVVQGVAAILPRRAFLRLSPFLQITALCTFVGGYFLQPALATPESLANSSNQEMLSRLPSYWFLALFEQLYGRLSASVRPALLPLAHRAWVSLACVLMIAAVVFVVSYVRTLRRIVEQPDLPRAFHRVHWLPPFGSALNTAITHFSIRGVLRSRQHRILLSFYAGIAFAISILFMKTPVARQLSAGAYTKSLRSVSVPALASSLVVMCLWMLAIRMAFGIPLELRANWLFRTAQIHLPGSYIAATRRAVYVLAAGPVWALSAAIVFSFWPLRVAAEHLSVLILVGIALAELSLYGFHKLPFTCSYLPGKSNLHITFALCLMIGLNAIYWSARLEYRALHDPSLYIRVLLCLGAAATFAWWRRSRIASEQNQLRFEEEAIPAISGLQLHRDGILPGWR
jgi:hypothetical protein